MSSLSSSNVQSNQQKQTTLSYFSEIELKPEKIEKITSQMKLMIAHLEDGAIREKLGHLATYLSSKSGKNMYKGYYDYYLDGIFSVSMEKYYDFYQAKDKKIIVTSKINYDGKGDYFQMWFAGQNLSQDLPGALISVSANVIERTLPQYSKSIQKIKNLVYASNEEFLEKKIEYEFEKNDLVLNIPYGDYQFNDPNKKTPIIRIQECGNTGKFCLGMDPMDCHILGIFLKDISPAESLHKLSHSSLKTYLTEKRNPFFLGYFSETGSEAFIFAALASHANRTDDIDIICPFKFLSYPSNKKLLIDPSELKKLNVAQISLMTQDENGQLQEKELQTLQSEGRRVRILNPFPLTNDDWMLLLKFCEPLTGCTGDMSFSEVVSNYKIPFYEIRSHKYQFFSQLLELTGETYKNRFIKLHKYLSLNNILMTKYGDERLKISMEMGALIDDALESEYRDFCALIRKYHTANLRITSIVKRALFLAENPQLKSLQDRLKKQWINDEITLQEACKTLQARTLSLL